MDLVQEAKVMRGKSSRLIVLLACAFLLLLVMVPAALAKNVQIPYRQLTASGTCLRPFTLLGYVDGNNMNLRVVSTNAAIYYVVNPFRHTFAYGGTRTACSDSRLVGSYVELWDTNADGVVDRILSVPRALSTIYWDARMFWLPGVGANTTPAVDDATGESIFSKRYVIPMGERQLVGYGIGDWSGTTDFSNLPNQTYWPFHDYYDATSSKTLTMLTHYRTDLQATGGTCGPASALSVLDWYGVRRDLNEKDLIALRQPQTRWGGFTSLSALTSIFTNLAKDRITGDWNLYSSYDDPNALFDSNWVQQTLAKGCPIMVGWNAFGPHWQVIIGYDNMGTPNTNDDVLIMMDPYDSTDHCNNGYTIQSYERLAYGIGFENLDQTGGQFWHTSFLVATPKQWHYKPVMGAGIRNDPTNIADFTDAYKIPYGDSAADIQQYYPDTPWLGPNGLAGAATGGYERSGDHNYSPYYRFFDFYNMESSPTRVMLHNFSTQQQVTEWTCGPSCALMVMNWFGKNQTDLTSIDLAQMRQNGAPGATMVNGMVEIFNTLNAQYGADWKTFTMRDYDGDVAALIPELLAKGIPMMIGSDEWGGHWQVIIGYDNMGTPGTQDDVLIEADPYDTTDHNQDGYFLKPFERLIYGWTARFDQDGAFVVAYPASQYPDLVLN
jgi:Papain-like cysteine protease AvrRpt2